MHYIFGERTKYSIRVYRLALLLLLLFDFLLYYLSMFRYKTNIVYLIYLLTILFQSKETASPRVSFASGNNLMLLINSISL